MLMVSINEAAKMLEEGVVDSARELDKVMKNATGATMGPLQQADFIGLDTCLAVLNNIFEQTGNEKYRPSDLLK